MTEKQFLKNFKKHCEIARDLGIYSKNEMVEKIRKGECPFTLDSKKEDYGGKFSIRQKLINQNFYWSTASFYKEHHPQKSMISILKSIPWRKP